MDEKSSKVPGTLYIDTAEDPDSKITYEGGPELNREEKDVYRQALRALNKSTATYAVGATFARHAYTGIWRTTKDLDVFIKPDDLSQALEALNQAGFETEIKAEHWLAKGQKDGHTIDLIFGNAHGHMPIDDRTFEGSVPAKLLGVKTQLIPIEEMIASIAFVAERRRFDGGELAHLIKCAKGKLDWQRILDRLGEHRELLLWHLILFDFIYPGHSSYLPKDLMVQLFEEARRRWAERTKKRKAFRGTLLDPFLFTVDVEDWGYEDQRDLGPLVSDDGEIL